MPKRTHEQIEENSSYAPTFLGFPVDVIPHIFVYIDVTTYIALHFVDKTSLEILQNYKKIPGNVLSIKWKIFLNFFSDTVRSETIRASVPFYQWISGVIPLDKFGIVFNLNKLFEHLNVDGANLDLVKYLFKQNKVRKYNLSEFMATASLNKSRKIFDFLHTQAKSRNDFSMARYHISTPFIGPEFQKIVSTGNLEFVQIFFQNSFINWNQVHDCLKTKMISIVKKNTTNDQILQFVMNTIGEPTGFPWM